MKTLSVLVWMEGLNASNYMAFSNENALTWTGLNNNFARASHCFVHFFAAFVGLPDENAYFQEP